MVKPSLYLAGLEYSGKTLIAYGLIKRLKQSGVNIGYFKPVAIARKRIEPEKPVDLDVLALKEALEIRVSEELLSPVTLPEMYLDLQGEAPDCMKRIVKSYQQLSAQYDAMVIEGYQGPEALVTLGLSAPQVAKHLESTLTLVVRCSSEPVADRIVDKVELYKRFASSFGVKLFGVILNAVQFHVLERLKDTIVPKIEALGVKVLGVIPESPSFLAPTVRDVAEVLNAEVLTGEDGLDGLVEDIVVGAMSLEATVRWIKRAANAALVTSGDRSDLILQVLELKPSVIVLTENLYPSARVLAKAREFGVPVLLVPYSTYEAVEMLKEAQRIIASMSLKVKERAIMNALERSLDWETIMRVLGI